jgi:hypothetical protein
MSHGRTFGKNGDFTLGERIHKRPSKEFVEEVLEAFNDHRIGEEEVCEMLGMRRAQRYKFRKRWLRSVLENKPFELYGRKERTFRDCQKRLSSGFTKR